VVFSPKRGWPNQYLLTDNTPIRKKEKFGMNMWQKMAVAGLVAGTLAQGSLPALAQSGSPWIDQREANQQNRINQGVNSGQLTTQEYNHLENRQNRINTAEAQMESDGHYTPAERARTRRLLKRSNRMVYRDKHNYRVD
jgi:hypothetical protein